MSAAAGVHGAIFETRRGRVARRARPVTLGGGSRKAAARGLYERSAEGAPAFVKVTSHSKSASHRQQRIELPEHCTAEVVRLDRDVLGRASANN